MSAARPVVAGIDLGGTAVNYTFVDRDERWLIDGLCEHPARSKEGPDVCLQQIADGLDIAVAKAGIALEHVVVVGLDTPGPASSTGVLSARGSTNFVHPAWAGFDLREALARKLGKPVTYLNDGNAGALWGHFTIFGAQPHRDLDLRHRRHGSGRWRHRRRQRRQGPPAASGASSATC